MVSCKAITILFLLFSITATSIPAFAEGTLQQGVHLKAGAYFPASEQFEVGNGIDLVYSVKPLPYAELGAGVGYYRADAKDVYTSGFISALPVTVSVRAILPLPYFSLYAVGGIGSYYKMLQLTPHEPPLGITELSADYSEWSLGYHANAGIEIPTSSGISLMLDYKYVKVDRGNFNSYNINHNGAFLYGSFAVNF